MELKKFRIKLKKQYASSGKKRENYTSFSYNELDAILDREEISDMLKISLIMQIFNFFVAENFWDKYGEKALELCKNSDELIEENLFSYLMFDWYNPEPVKYYYLSEKIEKYHQKYPQENVFEHLFSMIDNKNNCIYKYVIMRLLYQYLFETEAEFKCENDIKKFRKCINQVETRILNVADKDIKASGLKIIYVFGLKVWNSDDDTIESKIRNAIQVTDDERNTLNKSILMHIEETCDFLRFCSLLKTSENRLLEFQTGFDDHIQKMKGSYGDFFEKRINLNVQLLSILAEWKALYSIQNFIFQKFPYIGINTSIMTHFENVRAFLSFKVESFESKKLQDLVSYA